jgi:RHS repeat-associated protein
VFFDNLEVGHTRGQILEESHFNSWGMRMEGICSKAAGKLENKYQYNDGTELQSKEFSDGSGLELYATDYRSYDPQIGRMAQIDPLAEIAFDQSLFAYVNNNPISYNDPTGLTAEDANVVPVPKPKPPQVVYVPGKTVVTVIPSTPVEDPTPPTPAPSSPAPSSGSGEPTTEQPKSSYSFKEYVGKWEQDHGTTMTEAQKNILQTGCVGVVSLELGNNRNAITGFPATNPNYPSFAIAKKKAAEIENDIKVNRSKYSYGPRVLIYAIQFYSINPKKFLPGKNGEVDMSGWKKLPNPAGGYNFNYGWYDNRTNTWWDGTGGGRNMSINTHSGSLPNYQPDFNRIIYLVTTTSVQIK